MLQLFMLLLLLIFMICWKQVYLIMFPHSKSERRNRTHTHITFGISFYTLPYLKNNIFWMISFFGCFTEIFREKNTDNVLSNCTHKTHSHKHSTIVTTNRFWSNRISAYSKKKTCVYYARLREQRFTRTIVRLIGWCRINPPQDWRRKKTTRGIVNF